MATEESETVEELTADDIDGNFVPQPVEGVAAIELDGEVVLGVRAALSLQTHCLNRTGGIVWSCFDGEATLDDLIDDLSDVFKTPRDVVAEDVVNLTKQLGMIGLLAGVKPFVLEYQSPTGLDIGADLPPAELTDLDGQPTSLDAFRGNQMLLVNWSPFCGFCERIGPDFADLEDDLRDRGVELVLLALGDADQNRVLLSRHGLKCTVLLQKGNVEAFYGLGTPAAYSIDAAGKVASPLAVGAELVPALARELAGRAEEGPSAS